MTRKVITGMALLGIFMLSAQGATIRFKSNGSWGETTNSTGNARGWQTTGALPGTNDIVRANWGGDVGNVVTLDFATTVNKFQLGVGESGEFHIQNGGHLTTLIDSQVGNNGASAARKGTLTIDSGGEVSIGGWLGIGTGTAGSATVNGTLNVSGHLWMGTQNLGHSVGSLTIGDGGVVNVGGNIGLGTINASTASGGSATVTVNDGGLLSLDHWSATGSIQSNSVLNINLGGTVVVGGNRVSEANDYFTDGKIASDQGGINAIYDSETLTTTIVAIPEPATVGLVAMFGGAVLFIRRRFMI